jgi:hypothetical protein
MLAGTLLDMGLAFVLRMPPVAPRYGHVETHRDVPLMSNWLHVATYDLTAFTGRFADGQE